MKQASKKNWILVLVLALALSWVLFHNYLKINAPYIRTPEGKLIVPREIVKAQDCVSYDKFVQSLARPGFVPDPICPWRKVGPIGEFKIGEVTLRVPREYIWFKRNRPDGTTDGLNLMFKYPEMTPGDANAKDQSMNIAVLLKGLKPEACKDKTCTNYTQVTYGAYVLDYLNLRDKSAPLKRSYDNNIKLNTYRMTFKDYQGNLNGIKDVFYRGDMKSPSYWVVCADKYKTQTGLELPIYPGCETHFHVVGTTVAKASYRRSLLSKHEDIYQEIVRKLNSFMPPETKGEKNDH